MLREILSLFLRDLEKLREEIRAYPDPSSLWQISGSIKNSPGNLCLHLCGNLQHFIGARLGQSGYVRDRALEFSAKDLSKEFLEEEIRKTIQIVEQTLSTFGDERWTQDYPDEVFGTRMTNGYFLIHLYGHLNYHLGQINYHRGLR